MKKICIIGAGKSAFTLIEKILQNKKDVSITLVDKNKHYFDRCGLFELWSKNKGFKLCKLEDFCLNHSITFINDKVDRINFKRKKIYFKEKEVIDYESLIIATGLVSKKLDVKGDHKQGVFYFSDITPQEAVDFLSISNDCVVYVSTMLGLKFALELYREKKDVKCIYQDLSFLKDKQQVVIDLFKQLGIDFFKVGIDEFIGEAAVKAVKVKTPKIFSAHCVFIDSGFEAQRFVIDEDFGQKNTFFSSYEDVYILGAAAKENLSQEKLFINLDENITNQALSLFDYLINNKDIEYSDKISSEEEKDDYLNDFIDKLAAFIPAPPGLEPENLSQISEIEPKQQSFG